jgi:hypothetical protein
MPLAALEREQAIQETIPPSRCPTATTRIMHHAHVEKAW